MHLLFVHIRHPKNIQYCETFRSCLCSAVFILASLTVINNESLRSFNQRALRIAQGKGADDEMNKMNPWLCESHAIHSVVQKAKAICKPWQIEVAAYCFVALARCTLLCTYISLFKAIHTITTSRYVDTNVRDAFALIKVRLCMHAPMHNVCTYSSANFILYIINILTGCHKIAQSSTG